MGGKKRKIWKYKKKIARKKGVNLDKKSFHKNGPKFCKTYITVPGTSVSFVRLWHNTRGTGIPLSQYRGYRFRLSSFTPGVPGTSRILTSYLVTHRTRKIKYISIHVFFVSKRNCCSGFSCTAHEYSPVSIRQSWWEKYVTWLCICEYSYTIHTCLKYRSHLFSYAQNIYQVYGLTFGGLLVHT